MRWKLESLVALGKGIGWSKKPLGLGLCGAATIAFSAFATFTEPAASASRSDTAATSPLKTEVFRGGTGGFVVTEMSYVLGPDAKDSGACPNGMTAGVRGLVEAYAKTAAGQRAPSESADAYQRRMTVAVNTTASGQNTCMFPEAAAADPGWRMVSGDVKIDGLDLDGRDSSPGSRPAPGTCAHSDFRGADGRRRIDNQYYRVVGCTTGFQSTGQANSFQTEMYTGSWGILIELSRVDDLENDSDVIVGIYANADPIQLSAARAALPFATYAADRDARYRAETHGRISDGVLTIDPVDVRFHNIVNSMTDDRVLRGARLRLTFTADGGMEGFLAGYTPVEDMYDMNYGARHSRTAKGDLAPERLRVGTSVGRAGALGHSCNGAYYALRAAADGHRDPVTGQCTSISTQYRIRVAPAFVVNAQRPAGGRVNR